MEAEHVAPQTLARHQPLLARFFWYRSIGAPNGHGKVRKFHGARAPIIISLAFVKAANIFFCRCFTDSMFLNIHCLVGLSTSATAVLPRPTWSACGLPPVRPP